MNAALPDLDARPARLRIGWLAGGVLIAATGVALLHLFDPNTADSPFAPCFFHTLSGYWCAGCGITRALHALAHGDLAHALAMNPLAVLMLPLAALAWAWAGGIRPRWAAPVIAMLSKPMFWIALIPAYWIARNLPWPPFAWLAPGGFPGS